VLAVREQEEECLRRLCVPSRTTVHSELVKFEAVLSD
jgi:hypothetical protein